jgi:ABC-type polysaccharide/polyol phosphate export permease
MGGLKWVMRLNPLSYGLDGIRRALYEGRPQVLASLPPWTWIVPISAAFAVGLLLLASFIARGRVAADLM